MGDLLESAIPILGGMYATLMGYRVIENGTRFEAQLRFLGPVLAIFGYMTLFVACRRYPNGLSIFGLAFLIGAAVMLLAIMRSPWKTTKTAQGAVSCPNCGREVSPSSRVCPRCETRLHADEDD